MALDSTAMLSSVSTARTCHYATVECFAAEKFIINESHVLFYYQLTCVTITPFVTMLSGKPADFD